MSDIGIIALLVAILLGFNVFILFRLFRVEDKAAINHLAVAELLRLHLELLAEEEEDG